MKRFREIEQEEILRNGWEFLEDYKEHSTYSDQEYIKSVAIKRYATECIQASIDNLKKKAKCKVNCVDENVREAVYFNYGEMLSVDFGEEDEIILL